MIPAPDIGDRPFDQYGRVHLPNDLYPKTLGRRGWSDGPDDEHAQGSVITHRPDRPWNERQQSNPHTPTILSCTPHLLLGIEHLILIAEGEWGEGWCSLDPVDCPGPLTDYTPWQRAFLGWTLRIEAKNMTVIYRVNKYRPYSQAYELDWPD